MEQNLHSPEIFDFRRYDQVWKRVGPQMEPYPAGQSVEGAATPAAPAGSAQGAAESTIEPGASLALAQEPQLPGEQLPGAQPDPCCMGTAASEILDVLTGFIRDELEDRRNFLAMARRAPVWARNTLRKIAEDETQHARRLMAVYYLITGSCYHPEEECQCVYTERWCQALRQRYHEKACSALNYARAADGTTDVCLAKLLNDLSAQEYYHGDLLLAMLERSMGGA